MEQFVKLKDPIHPPSDDTRKEETKRFLFEIGKAVDELTSKEDGYDASTYRTELFATVSKQLDALCAEKSFEAFQLQGEIMSKMYVSKLILPCHDTPYRSPQRSSCRYKRCSNP